MFINSHLLDGVAYGSVFGASFRTLVEPLKSGAESRLITRSWPLGKYAILLERLRPDDHAKIFAAFNVCRGRGHTFRLRDRIDYRMVDVQIGVGTGSAQTYQLMRQYDFGVEVYQVPVTLPEVATLELTADGAPVAYTVNGLTGVVTLTAGAGAAVRASGLFDKRVRFDDDDLDFTLETRGGGIVPLLTANVPLREVRE